MKIFQPFYNGKLCCVHTRTLTHLLVILYLRLQAVLWRVTPAHTGLAEQAAVQEARLAGRNSCSRVCPG